MNTHKFREYLAANGIKITTGTIRHHARAGRIGKKTVDGWRFSESDIEVVRVYYRGDWGRP